ncbi:GNAT family N-acetyltransferase [Streptomyces roseicoloratus]|uniref:GNAT family N-acetyltransferase n=1 Tax=Streptomyces roseicoloratus TaxID=2508722 RepID=UPI001009D28C|nr:GNAT family N-acetyltransferase [Streptomyces roseicoloratus]
MDWHFTEDPEVFRRAAYTWLSAEPARNTTLLGMPDAVGLRGWWDGPGGGGFLATPAGMLLLGAMPDAAARALGAAPLPNGREVTSVRGESGTVEAYVRAGGRPWRTTHRLRLFRLAELTPPHPAPRGAARVAAPADVPLAATWMREYARDVGEDATVDYTANVAARVADVRLHFWETDGGPVAMASVSPTTAGQARVSTVYTPPAHRARGYGGAATVAATRAALSTGARQVLLFTDTANPTSNALYQRLGYRPLGDHRAMEPEPDARD